MSATAAASTPSRLPPLPSTESAANCAVPEKAVADMAIASRGAQTGADGDHAEGDAVQQVARGERERLAHTVSDGYRFRPCS